MIVSITPELGIEGLSIFAGGLGVLEGDKFYAAARLGVPYTVITLFYPEGYVKYREENGKLVPTAEPNQLGRLTKVGDAEFAVRGGHRLHLLLRIQAQHGNRGVCKG
jgi:starch phosphorylase